MILTIRPVSGWTGPRTPPAARKRHNFTRQKDTGYGRVDIPWSETLLLLDRELVALRADAVVLQLDVTERDVRLDGQLRANANPSDPGVRLLFDSKHGPLTYQCDRFWTWQDNVRAIALGLEALRKVERYGITEHGEQYKGWLQLEAGTSTGLPTSRAQAAELLSRITGVHIDADESKQSATARWKAARAIAHPDRNNGSRDLWDQVEAAAQLLGLDQP